MDEDERRLNRLVYLMERIGTPAARDVLESISRGEPRELATESARSALARSPKAKELQRK